MNPCGAKTRSGTPCQRKPVAGGKRCKLHGGASLRGAESPTIKHGRYSKYLRQSLQDKLAGVDDGNPLDLLPELQMQRALFTEYVHRFQPGITLGMGDIDALMGWSEQIGRMVERIVKMRNETALTQAEMQFLAARIVELVGKYVSDPDQRQAFISELFAGVPTLATGDVEH